MPGRGQRGHQKGSLLEPVGVGGALSWLCNCGGNQKPQVRIPPSANSEQGGPGKPRLSNCHCRHSGGT